MKKIDWGILEKLAILVVIISGIIASIYYLWGGIKMVWSMFIIPINSFWLIIAIWFFIPILLGINRWNRKKKEEELRTLKSKFEGENKHLKSELEGKTNRYDAFIEQIKLPKTFDKAITVETNPIWGKTHPSNIVVVHNPGDIFPSLYFDMRVVNRTYFSFEAEEIEINCFCGEETMYRGTWNKKIGQPKPEAFDKFSDLPKFGDGTIEVHILLTKRYNNLEKWNLEGSAKYGSKEPLIEDDTQYTNPERDIHLEYVLSEKQITKLKKEIEEALGWERE